MMTKITLERDASAELDFAAGRGGFADGAELRGVHEAVRRAEIDVVEGVEKFAAELEFGALGEVESTSEREVESLHARAVDGVAAHVAEGEGSGRREGCWIEPFRCIVRAGGKNWLAGEVPANGIFAEDVASVPRFAQNGNGERESALDLVDRGESP